MTYKEMCERIAEGWTKVGFQGREWTGVEVFEFDPNGELFWLPGQYVASLGYLGREEELRRFLEATCG